MYCSFGNGYRLTKDAAYKDILLESAATLITRYKPTIGCIRSWDHSRDKWECPVIIDNMMNLELLYWAFKETGDSVYYLSLIHIFSGLHSYGSGDTPPGLHAVLIVFGLALVLALYVGEKQRKRLL